MTPDERIFRYIALLEKGGYRLNLDTQEEADAVIACWTAAHPDIPVYSRQAGRLWLVWVERSLGTQ